MKSLFLTFSLLAGGSLTTLAQQPSQTMPDKSPAPKTTATPEKKKDEKPPKTADSKNPNAEQVAESVIIVYGGSLAGRENLKQIRRTTIENGKITITNAEGVNEQVAYARRVTRGDSLDKEKIRLDQEFPNAKYALIYADNKVVGLYNDSIFTPREDAAKAFQNQIWHGLEALLRYKENGSTLQLSGKEKSGGIDLYTLEVTDKEKRQTKFYVSAKTFKVLWLEYAEDGVKYKRKFYDYRYAQGTLVPYRVVLLADDKQIEEAMVSTSTFGQKLDEEIYKAN